jgi:hypothetical protein
VGPGKNRTTPMDSSAARSDNRSLRGSGGLGEFDGGFDIGGVFLVSVGPDGFAKSTLIEHPIVARAPDFLGSRVSPWCSRLLGRRRHTEPLATTAAQLIHWVDELGLWTDLCELLDYISHPEAVRDLNDGQLVC